MLYDQREQADDASKEAAAWLIRLEQGELTTPEREQFADWIAGDPQHARAYRTLQSLWQDLDHLQVADVRGAAALAPLDEPSAMAPGGRSAGWRSRLPPAGLFRTIGVGLAASIVLGVVLWMQYGIRLRADAVTSVGEVRTIALSDGSSVILNTDSAIRLRFSGTTRRVELLAGEAAFTVAPDAGRPFVVEAMGGTTRALGTEFVVRRSGEEVVVTDVEHTIAVHYAHVPGEPSPTLVLTPGQQVRYSARSGLAAVKIDSGNARAWTRGRLVFEAEPLGEVIAELNRYHHGLIRITDSRLNELKVSGVFQLGDPIGIIDTLERSLGVHSTRFTDYIVLIHG